MMELLLLTISALLFYSASEYFPFSIPENMSVDKSIHNVAATIFLVLGIVLMNQSMDITTAIVAALVIVMTLIPLLVLSLSTYPKSWIGWVLGVIVIAMIDMLHYAG